MINFNPNPSNLNRRTLMRVLSGTGLVAAAGGFFPARAAAWVPNDHKKVNMILRSTRPDDWEMPLDGFLEEFTPIERFFSRTHHYPVKVDLATYRLEVKGAVTKPLSLNFETIQKMEKVTLPAVLECAGNGRAFYEPSMPGLQWEHGAVANGKWAGVRLADVLKMAGIKDDGVEVVFDGADVPIGTMPDFQRSIPRGKALSDCLLAYELNDKPLPSLHGFPLRVIVPGWAGDCWVKWVTRIEVLTKDFDGFFMKSAYRHPGKAVKPGSAVDPAAMSPVQSLRVKSVIATPATGTEFVVGENVTFRGVAWTGDSARINKVEVTLDGGQTWNPAQPGSYNGDYAWRSWQFSRLATTEEFWNVGVRAGDANGNIQPMICGWNPSGYLWNAIHMIGINIVKERSKPASAPTAVSDAAKPNAPASYKTSCIGCHEDDVIKQQRLTRGQWEKEVDKMVRWGANVKPADKETLLDYLAKEFPYKRR